MPHLTVTQAADRLGVSKSRVKRMLARGILTGTRPTRAWMIDEASVQERLDTPVKAGRPRKIQAPPVK